jgi:hypothetical protein
MAHYDEVVLFSGTSTFLITYCRRLFNYVPLIAFYVWKVPRPISLPFFQLYIFVTETIAISISFERQSEWPRGLRHELSPPAQTLGSWVRIPLKAWIFVCVYSVFVLSCLPWDGLIPRTRSPTDCVKD